jgi:hypothetical protein
MDETSSARDLILFYVNLEYLPLLEAVFAVFEHLSLWIMLQVMNNWGNVLWDFALSREIPKTKKS